MGKVTLADFGPGRVWFVSLAVPMGLEVDLVNGEDPSTGEPYRIDVEEAESMVPEAWWDLEGTVSADGLRWEWDLAGTPLDWNQNTVTQLSASRTETPADGEA